MLRRAVFAVFLTLVTLLPAVAAAQFDLSQAAPTGPIGVRHPQATVYANPSAWPHLAYQGHLCSRDKDENGDGVPDPCTREEMKHGHLYELKCPIYAVVTPATGVITCPVQIMAYQVNGVVSRVAGNGPNFPNHLPLSFAGFPSSMVGDPTGLKVWHGTVEIDTRTWNVPGSQHGWTAVTLAGDITFDDGSKMECAARVPFWSEIDTTQPVNPDPEGFIRTGYAVMMDCAFTSVRGPSADNQQIRTNDFLPIAPIQGAWTNRWEGARYGATNKFEFLDVGATEVWRDASLHVNDFGTLLAATRQKLGPNDGFVGTTVVIDAATTPEGAHRCLARWSQPLPKNELFPGGHTEEALITYPCAVGSGTAPPPVDTDGDGVNDPDDHCPTVAGPVSNHGCPVGTPPPDLEAARRAKLTEVEQAFIALQSANIANVGQALITLGARLLELRALFGG